MAYNPRLLCHMSRFYWGWCLKKELSVKRGRHSENEDFGKDLYRKDSLVRLSTGKTDNSVKRSGPFTEPPDS